MYESSFLNGRSGDCWDYKKFCLYSCAKLLLKVVHMSEQFILTILFKHETKPIEEQAMRDYLAFIKKEFYPESEFWL